MLKGLKFFSFLVLAILLGEHACFAANSIKLKLAVVNSSSVSLSVSVPRSLRKLKPSISAYRVDINTGTPSLVSAKRSRRSVVKLMDLAPPTGNVRYVALVSKGKVKRWSAFSDISISENTPPAAVPPAAEPWWTREPAAYSGQVDCPDGFEQDVLDAVNEVRSTKYALTGNKQLAFAARAHTRDMARSQVLSQDGWIDYINSSGYRGNLIAENIAMGLPRPRSVVIAWLNSPGHRMNILNPEYTEMGIGCIQDVNGQFWWAQVFGG